ncbi:hypothetical protein QQZ08_008441 [Neonectria magnoliae]|uniref:Uncharacterized protein n=1 Tax=Neonectria magnoliae TaxID=2732573 RepID=A0ABR1HUE2_9HYPO
MNCIFSCIPRPSLNVNWHTPTSRGWIYVYVFLVTTASILALLWVRSKLRRHRFARARRRAVVDVESGTSEDVVLRIPAPAVEASWRPGRTEGVEMMRMNNAAAARRSWECTPYRRPEQPPSYNAVMRCQRGARG